MRHKLRSAYLLSLLAFLGFAQPAHAQLSGIKWRIHGGIMNSLAVSKDYFSMGPSIAVDAAYALAPRVNVQLDLGWDYLNTDDTHPTPVTNLWRYRAELEGMLMGDGESGVAVSAFAGGGLTTISSHKFWLVSQQQKHMTAEGVPYTFEGERLRGTAPTGVLGLRIGAHSPDGIMWWLSGKLNYTKLNQFNSDALHELSTNRFEPNGLDPIKSVMNFAITLGVGL